MGSGCCIGNCCIGKAIKDKLKEWLFGSSSGSSSGGRTSSYDPEHAQMQETIRVQNALTEFRTDTQTRSINLENAIIEESREHLDAFLADVRKYNKIKYGGRSLSINISHIERENRKTEDKIHGFIVKKVSKRISLDDEECLKILKLDAGAEKTKELDHFYRKVLSEAISELMVILQNAMEQQTDTIEERIQQRMDSIVDVYEAKSGEFERIQKIKNTDEVKLEQAQIKLSYFVALCEYGLSLTD